MMNLFSVFRKPVVQTPPKLDLTEHRLQLIENVRYLGSCLKAVNAKLEDLKQRGGAKVKHRIIATEKYRDWLESKLIEEKFGLKIFENN